MLFEGVVGELQALLRAIRPKVPVHAAVDRLAILVDTGPPGIIPKAAVVTLTLIANELRNIRTFAASTFECPKYCKAAWPGTDDRDPISHLSFPLKFAARGRLLLKFF
jgi:hypothetical protein